MRGLGAKSLAVVGAVALVGCGGGGGDEQDEIDLVPAVAVEPCDLLDEEQAAALSGGDVEPAESSVADDGTATCSFAAATGSAIVASLTIGPGDEDDLPTGSALARSLDLGDAGVVEEDEDEVRVSYVVEDVVVTVQVAPADGEVTADLVEEVIDFAESTVEPVKQARPDDPDDDQAADEPEETTTTSAAVTTTEPQPTTTTEPEEEVIPIEVGGAAVTASFDRQERIIFGFDAVAGDVIRVEVLDIAAADAEFDATNPCVNIVLVSASGGFGSFCSLDLAQRPARDLPINETGAYTMRLSVGGPGVTTVTFQVVPGAG